MFSEDLMARVMIVDDHDMARQALKIALELFDGISLVGEASNGQEAIEVCSRVHPDVILMDVIMPVMDGIAATTKIHQQYPDIAVIVLTSSVEHSQQDVFDAGAVAYLPKNASIDQLIDTI